MKPPRLDQFGKLDGVPRAVDVGFLVRLVIGTQVVDRRQVEEMPDLPDSFSTSALLTPSAGRVRSPEMATILRL
jgi:hypothetical protein